MPKDEVVYCDGPGCTVSEKKRGYRLPLGWFKHGDQLYHHEICLAVVEEQLQVIPRQAIHPALEALVMKETATT